MKLLKGYFFILLSGISFLAQAQSANIPLNKDYYHLIDRYEIKNGKLSENFHSSFKGYQRHEVAGFIDSMQVSSEADEFNKSYLQNDNWEFVEGYDKESRKSFLKHFYKKPSDLYHVKTKGFDLHVNPVLHLSLGNESASDARPFINTRGVQIRGMIDGKVGFYSYIGENQARFPQYIRQYTANTLAVPGEGFWKSYKDGGVDYFTARGYISFNATKHINIQFGRDQFSVGNGERSLILSDFAPAHTFLKVKTKVWKFQYTNLFTQMTADITGNTGGLFGNDKYPHKYMAMHHLSLNIGKKVNIGLFESIMFGEPDSLGNNFELRYLNPIIFYRAIEQQDGSSGNALLGLAFKWLVKPGISMYGQIVLDEFLLDNLAAGNGWWGNKYGIQLGAKYIDAFGVDNLDLQLEGNIVRPYTYSHNTIYTNYAHYHQSLAHPMGANLQEMIAILRYQPVPKLYVSAKAIRTEYGKDDQNTNWGGNILKNNSTRKQDFNNNIAQGIRTELYFLDFTASYQLKHNLFIDLKEVIRNDDSDNDALDQKTSFTNISLRWNIAQRLHQF